MGYSLDKVLRHSALLALAGERYFERGEGYYRDGRVRDLVEHEGVLVAKVVGTHEYRVKLWSEGEDLRYSCNCPLGVDEEFCKHCVAVGLEFLYGKRSEEPAEVMGRLRSYLEGREKEELIRLLLDHASEDEVLPERLSMTAAGEGPDAPDINAFRQVIDRAFDPGDFMEPYPDYIRGIENVVESLSGLLGRGFAAETVELAEYALRTAEDAMDYDVDGYMTASFTTWKTSTTQPAKRRIRTRRRWRGGSSSGSCAATTIRSSRRPGLTRTFWANVDSRYTGSWPRGSGNVSPGMKAPASGSASSTLWRCWRGNAATWRRGYPSRAGTSPGHGRT